MTKAQKTIKYLALGLAALLILAMVSSVFRIVLFLFGEESTTEELSAVEIEGEYDALALDLSATSLRIQIGETFAVKTNHKNLTFDVEDGVLSVKEKKHRPFEEREDPLLILTVPEEFSFRSVEVSIGAGDVSVEALRADRIDFEFGAGEVRIERLIAESAANIEGGAGKLVIGGVLRDLDLDMGVGELDLNAELLGNASIDCGIGEAKITLLGDAENYTFNMSKGIGEVTLNGEALTDGMSVGNGSVRVSVSGGIGAIRILTEEKSS